MPDLIVQTKWGPWDRAAYLKLKRAYGKAVQDGSESFKIGDQLVLTRFAKYLLEYLEMNEMKEEV